MRNRLEGNNDLSEAGEAGLGEHWEGLGGDGRGGFGNGRRLLEGAEICGIGIKTKRA